MLALAQFEAETCSGCGHHISVTEDPSNVFMPSTRVCPVCAGQDQYARIQADEDEKADKALGDKPAPQKPRAADGRKTYMRPLSPDEIEAAKTKGGDAGGNTA
jgi:hypothetical protein